MNLMIFDVRICGHVDIQILPVELLRRDRRVIGVGFPAWLVGIIGLIAPDFPAFTHAA